MLSRAPIESVAEAQRRARRRLPTPVYKSLVAGVEKGFTLMDNVAAFDDVGFRPRIAAKLPPERDMATTVLGEPVSMPVVVSPAGAQAIDPGGEVAVAKAAAAADVAMGLSAFASMPFEAVVRENPKAFFQVYWVGTREHIAERVERARAARAKALIDDLLLVVNGDSAVTLAGLKELAYSKIPAEFSPLDVQDAHDVIDTIALVIQQRIGEGELRGDAIVFLRDVLSTVSAAAATFAPPA
jgi:isopentenyl diphosphate isomerase/L-lactate dehydrogenase-like FMN-dependent dehydrogenase